MASNAGSRDVIEAGPTGDIPECTGPRGTPPTVPHQARRTVERSAPGSSRPRSDRSCRRRLPLSRPPAPEQPNSQPPRDIRSRRSSAARSRRSRSLHPRNSRGRRRLVPPASRCSPAGSSPHTARRLHLHRRHTAPAPSRQTAQRRTSDSGREARVSSLCATTQPAVGKRQTLRFPLWACSQARGGLARGRAQ